MLPDGQEKPEYPAVSLLGRAGRAAASQVLYYLHNFIGVPEKAYQDSFTDAYISNTDGLVLQPSDVQLDSSSYSSGTWGAMPLTLGSSSSYSGVSTLMLQMGLYLGAVYKQNSTSSCIEDFQTVFEDYYSIYSNGSYNVDFDIIADQIFRENMPVILAIFHYDTVLLDGHAVIIDACKEHYQHVRKTYRRQIPSMSPNLDPIYEIIYVDSDEMLSRYVGINWGWNGSYMTSGDAPIWFNTDAITWDVGTIYNYLYYMIYGFHSE